MGRRLYSSLSTITHVNVEPAAVNADDTATAPAPAVRAAPDAAPDQPEVSQWSYWNAFDPDADEFFDGPNAVYEAFVDPSTLPPLREEIALEEAGDGRNELQSPRLGVRRMSVLSLEESSPSSSSSEGTASGRESPVDPPFADEVEENPPTLDELTDDEDDVDRPAAQQSAASTGSVVRVQISATHYVPFEREAARPVTPPPRPPTPSSNAVNTSTTTPLVYEPSPPPTVTPRIFTWAGPRNDFPTSPLPNRNARTTTVHLAHFNMPPAIVNRVQG